MNKTTLLAILGVVIFAGGLYVLSSGSKAAPTQNPPSPIVTDSTSSTPVPGTGKTHTINYTGSGFSPASLAIAMGDTVLFVKGAGSRDMWIAGGHHPTHESLDGTTRSEHCAAGYSGPKPFDECALGTQYSYTFEKSGAWTFHNHYSDDDRGIINVQ